jgi:hypothetical protein
LLAHELAHVVQQSSGNDRQVGGSRLLIGARDDPAEHEAQRAVERVTERGAGPAAVPTLGRESAHHGEPPLRRQTSEDQLKKRPKPLIPLPHPLDGLDIKPIVPLPGHIQSPSSEDVNKALHGLPGQQGSGRAEGGCLPGSTFHKIGSAAGMCCVEDEVAKCCPPRHQRVTPVGLECDRKAGPDKAPGKPPASDTAPGPPAKAGPPASVPGETSLKLKLPPQTPALTMSFPIHFKHNQPGAVVTGEKALRGSLTNGGGSDLDLVIGWLKQKPDFSVQLLGMASVEGPAAHNLELGEIRARSIASALAQNGISPARIADPPGQVPACIAIRDGIENCGDSRASKSVDANDRQVLARLFVAPAKQ